MPTFNRQDYTIHRRTFASVLVVLSPFFVLDWFEFLGRFYRPDSVGRVACFAFPLAKVSVLFVSRHLVEYAGSQCTVQPRDPALSIIFYMLKIAIAVGAAVIMTTWIYVVPVWVLPPRLKKARVAAFQRISTHIERDGGVIGQVKHFGPFIVGLVLFCVAIALSGLRSEYIGVSLTDKFIEDCTALTIFITTLLTMGCLSSWTFYVLTHRPSLDTSR